MFFWALVFFVIAIIAALFGFTGIAAGATTVVAKILFFNFLVLSALTLIVGLFARRRGVTPPEREGP